MVETCYNIIFGIIGLSIMSIFGGGDALTLLICPTPDFDYRICSRNLRTFFPILAAEKSECVKYADFFVEVLIWVLF
jgi:hypothetical protein